MDNLEAELRSMISDLHHLRVDDNLKRDQEDVRLASSIAILTDAVDKLREEIRLIKVVIGNENKHPKYFNGDEMSNTVKGND